MKQTPDDNRKCLKCQDPRRFCKCEGGFKVMYYKGRPVSEQEASGIPTFDEAMANAKRAAKEIDNILGNGKKR